MSLTNPNDFVTEERLSEFYQGILPYLGGMPENNYSIDEKIIGTWIDGSPIYQRTFSGTTPSTSGQLATITFSPSNIKTLVNCYGCVKSTGYDVYIPTADTSADISIMFGVDQSSHKFVIQARGPSSYLNKPYYVTMQYLKTS